MIDPVQILKTRLRDDLKATMQARHAQEAKLLRVILAAIDNAEAVSIADISPAESRPFADGSAEVPRRRLSEDDLFRLIQVEIDSRLAAAADYVRLSRPEEAARLEAEAKTVARYLPIDRPYG